MAKVIKSWSEPPRVKKPAVDVAPAVEQLADANADKHLVAELASQVAASVALLTRMHEMLAALTAEIEARKDAHPKRDPAVRFVVDERDKNNFVKRFHVEPLH